MKRVLTDAGIYLLSFSVLAALTASEVIQLWQAITAAVIGLLWRIVQWSFDEWARADLRDDETPPLRRFLYSTALLFTIVLFVPFSARAMFEGNDFWAVALQAVVILGSTAVYVWMLAPRFWRAWLPPRWRTTEAPPSWLDAYIAGVALTIAFVSIHGAAVAAGGPPTAPALRGESAFIEAANYYLWNAANAVPLVDATETLDWHVATKFPGHINGVFLLIYKILVILPVLNVFVETLRNPPPPKPRSTAKLMTDLESAPSANASP